MNGGIPSSEIDKFSNYFKVFPNIKSTLFRKINDFYYELSTENLKETLKNHPDILKYKENYKKQFENFDNYLKDELICTSCR